MYLLYWFLNDMNEFKYKYIEKNVITHDWAFIGQRVLTNYSSQSFTYFINVKEDEF